MDLPLQNFNVEAVDRNDPYLDISFGDTHRNGDCRWWRVTFDGDTGEWYGMLYRSDTPDDAFEKEVKLPARAVEQLAALAEMHLANAVLSTAKENA